jgi:hypothetical protein
MLVNVKPGQSHQLPLRRKFFFGVTNFKARKALSEEVSERSWLSVSRKFKPEFDRGRGCLPA